MMRVVSAEEMARIEQIAYAAGASEETFMEAAGRGIARAVQSIAAQKSISWQVTLLCGKGNNAGDAYVAGMHLLRSGFRVRSVQLSPLSSCSPLCQKQAERFGWAGGEIVTVTNTSEIVFLGKGLILDGIFGTGFKGVPEGIFAAAIKAANSSGLPIIAVDLPSGINGTTGEVGATAIRARATVCLGLPKTGFFFDRAWDYVGQLLVVDFGLGPDAIAQAHADFQLLAEQEAASLLPPINRTRHKYEAGYVVGWSGSKLMPGAAILAGKAALRTGAGIVRILHAPDLQLHGCGAPAELIAQPMDSIEPALWDRAKVVFAGPGIGVNAKSQSQLQELLKNVNRPLVLDADALTILSQLGEYSLPPQTILTPHHGEMARLLGDSFSGRALIAASQKFTEKMGCVLILKGSPTFVFCAGSLPTVITRGDPGMATAGSGDVLTGMVSALLAQGLEPAPAARLGVALHGIAGELAAERLTSYSVTASDLIEALPHAFRALQRMSDTT